MPRPGRDRDAVRLLAQLIGERERIRNRAWLGENLRVGDDPHESAQHELRNAVGFVAVDDPFEPAAARGVMLRVLAMRVHEYVHVREEAGGGYSIRVPFDRLGWNRARYSAYAPFYDALVGRLGFLARGRRRALELAAIRPGEKLLIVAAGTGLDLPLLPAGVEIAAIDIAPAMLRRLQRRARRLELRVHAEVMDAARLGFADASFDCVLLHLAIAVVPDPQATMREVARVLRPGGRVSVFDKFLPDDASPSPVRALAGRLADWVATDLNRKLGPLLAGCGLTLVAREPAGLGGLFVVARADKAK